MSKGFRRTIGIVLVVLVISILAPAPLVVAYHLIVGWVSYLASVLPHVRVNISGVVTAIVCLVATIAIGHSFARWLWLSATSSASEVRWRMRWTLSVVSIVVLMFVAGIGATGVGHQTAWLARSEQPMFANRGREAGNRVKCASNLKQIGLAMGLYSQKHDGSLPDSLFDVLRSEDISTEIFCCPSSNDEKALGATPAEQVARLRHGRHCSYVYHGRGLTLPQPGDVPIACEPLTNHGGEGMNILFGDGHVEFLPPDEARQLLRRRPTSQPGQPATDRAVLQ